MLNAVYEKKRVAERKRDRCALGRQRGLPEALHADNGADFRSRAFSLGLP